MMEKVRDPVDGGKKKAAHFQGDGSRFLNDWLRAIPNHRI